MTPQEENRNPQKEIPTSPVIIAARKKAGAYSMDIKNDFGTSELGFVVRKRPAENLNQKVAHFLEKILPTCEQLKISPGADLSVEPLERLIDHTLLKPEATELQIRKVCSEAAEYEFATVCVNSSRIELTTELLKGSKTLPICVVGFPLGAMLTRAKVFETEQAILAGAREIDMVINVGFLKDRRYDLVLTDILAVVEAARPLPVKVILETALLSKEEKAIACALSKEAGAAFVKTSTGFANGGATAEDIRLMRQIVGTHMGVKASGGIRSYADAVRMIEAGANRLGASASVAIVTQVTSNSSSY